MTWKTLTQMPGSIIVITFSEIYSNQRTVKEGRITENNLKNKRKNERKQRH